MPWFWRVEHRLPWIYGLAALLIGVALCLLVPPFFGADEAAQSFRALSLAHGYVLAEHTGLGAGAPVDTGLLEAAARMTTLDAEIVRRYPIAHLRPAGRVDRAALQQVRQFRWTGREAFHAFPNTALYGPLLYLPAAVAWRLGELEQLSIVHSLLLVRVVTLLVVVLLGWTALCLCVSGRWLLFAYLLLPAVLNLSALCSQDALLLPVSALLAVLLGRAVAAARALTAAELIAVSLLLLACVGAKPTNLLLTPLLLLPTLNLPLFRCRALAAPCAALAVLVVLSFAW